MIRFKDKAGYLEVSVVDDNGDFVTGLTITYEVRDISDNSLFASGTLTAAGNIYKAAITFTSVGQYTAIYTTPAGYQNLTEIFTLEEQFGDKVTLDAIYNVEYGRWKIDTALDQLVLYKPDNSTEIARFDLKDATGSPTSDNPFERTVA